MAKNRHTYTDKARAVKKSTPLWRGLQQSRQNRDGQTEKTGNTQTKPLAHKAGRYKKQSLEDRRNKSQRQSGLKDE